MKKLINQNFKILLLGLILSYCNFSYADVTVYEIQIKDHLFLPDKLEIPSNKKVKLVIKNMDTTSEEFESYELNREKIIMGSSKAIIFIGPLRPGIYPFFGEFNPLTAKGEIVAK